MIAQHIESIIKGVDVIQRGPNCFLVLEVESGKVLLNEYGPAELYGVTNYKKDGVFRTHWGDFTPDGRKALVGQMLKCDARPHKKYNDEFYFTSNVVFEDLGLQASNPDAAQAIDDAIQQVKEQAAQTPVETNAPEAVEEKSPVVENAPETIKEEIPEAVEEIKDTVEENVETPEAVEDAPKSKSKKKTSSKKTSGKKSKGKTAKKH